MNIQSQTKSAGVILALALVLNAAIGGTTIAMAADLSNPKRGVIDLTGKIVKGDCQHFKSALKPDITKVVLTSYGGMVSEGECMSSLVSAYQLQTNVPSLCMSICFLIFAAGRQRVVANDARVGVHRPSLPDKHELPTPRLLNEILGYYARYNVPTEIQQKTAQTPPSSIYVLNDLELQSMGVRRYQIKPATDMVASSARIGVTRDSGGQAQPWLGQNPLSAPPIAGWVGAPIAMLSSR